MMHGHVAAGRLTDSRARMHVPHGMVLSRAWLRHACIDILLRDQSSLSRPISSMEREPVTRRDAMMPGSGHFCAVST